MNKAYLHEFLDPGAVFSVENNMLWIEWKSEAGYLFPVTNDDARALRDLLNKYLGE